MVVSERLQWVSLWTCTRGAQVKALTINYCASWETNAWTFDIIGKPIDEGHTATAKDMSSIHKGAPIFVDQSEQVVFETGIKVLIY